MSSDAAPSGRNSLGTVFGSFIGSSNAQSTEDEMINQPSNGTSQARFLDISPVGCKKKQVLVVPVEISSQFDGDVFNVEKRHTTYLIKMDDPRTQGRPKTDASSPNCLALSRLFPATIF